MRPRSNVTFRYPEELVPVADPDDVLATQGAAWFVALLKRIAGLELDPQLCQEDWGVVVFARRNGKSFWLGVSSAGDYKWWVHVHHGSFAWLQKLSATGKAELDRLIEDLSQVLADDPNVSDIRWHREADESDGSPTPHDPT